MLPVLCLNKQGIEKLDSKVHKGTRSSYFESFLEMGGVQEGINDLFSLECTTLSGNTDEGD
jgi:hypothetical protein